jgi:microcystin-dependent protein
MELIHLVVIFLVFVVLYLLYKTRNLEKLSIEKFETDIVSAVNNKYTADMDGIRNLASVANTIITTNDSLRIPATDTYAKNLILDGGIKINNKESVMLEIFPRFMILAWGSQNIPLGWAICDGRKYSLDNDYKAMYDITGNGILTPDLRGRFILGAGFGAKDMNNKPLLERKLGEVGGEERNALTIEEMPGHNHEFWSTNNNSCEMGGGGGLCAANEYLLTKNRGGRLRPGTGKKSDGADKDYPDAAIWDAVPHNNMPPYFVLMYIMKL